MIYETLHGAGGADQTRIKRAFGWVVTFRDFPPGSWQVVGGITMMTEALTFFTKGRAEFYLDGVRRGDRIPGILSNEHQPLGLDGTFTLKYTESTTRVCIPSAATANRGKLPEVTQLDLEQGDQLLARPGFKALVCLGEVQVGDKIFVEESTFQVKDEPRTVKALSKRVLLLDFSKSSSPR